MQVSQIIQQTVFWALKWTICDKFHDYLYGNKFTVRTANNPLTCVLTTAKLDATGYRWLAALSSYNFFLVYRSGKENLHADALSRLPSSNKETLFNEAIKAICQGVLASNEEVHAVVCVCFWHSMLQLKSTMLTLIQAQILIRLTGLLNRKWTPLSIVPDNC